ncbi:MAG: DMT family transporter [Beijerinckiaceae bacterium]|nr:DMT family transporter [Beijerinckiaceae bacterium]MCZ8299765.1 DMT family transporter [Beijerinckiaceae bacterium]
MTLSRRSLAILAMLGAATIYGTNFAISRHGIQNGMTPNDMTFVRFLVAGIILLPLFVRSGLRDCAGIGWGRGLVLTVMSGLPMTLLMMQGLAWSPAAHGAAIGPGTVTVIGAIGGWLMFGNKPGWTVILGIAIVVAGLAMIGLAASTSGSRNVLLGDLCFFGVGLIWGGYPLMLQLWKVDPLRATAVLSVLSAVAFSPWYLLAGGSNLLNVNFWVVALHAINQGVINVVIGLWLWGFAVREVGAALSGRFPPLIPVIGTLTAIPLLGEIPGAIQWAGIALIVGGLMVTTIRPGPGRAA